MPANAESIFKSAIDKIGYSYDSEEQSSLSDVYCESKQVRTRGLGQSFLADVAKYLPLGLSAKGEGEIEIAEGLTVEHLAREGFEGFRQFLGVSEEAYLRSFSEVTGGAVSDGGRSGSLYWFSGNKRYLLKSSTESDLDKLVDMMPRYLEHFQGAKRAGRPCFLLRFFGAYRLRAGNEVLILLCMNDVWDGQKPTRIYDLKGTTQHRYVDVEEEQSAGVVLKDLNLDSYFIIDNIQGNQVWNAFAMDAKFLENENSIDYSLLLGVDDGTGSQAFRGFADAQTLPCYRGYEYPEDVCEDGASSGGCCQAPAEIEDEKNELVEPVVRRVRLGIIDFLGQWNAKKKTERWYKNLRGCCEEHSSMPPDYYRDRWVRYLEDKIVVDDVGEEK